MPTLQERFADEAERLLLREGTEEPMPFVERGRDPMVGLDCLGLVLVAAGRTGRPLPDAPYVLVPGADYWTPMMAAVEAAFDPVEGEWARGDLLAFRFGAMRNHLGVCLGENRMVHVSDGTGLRRAVRTPLDRAHRRMVDSAWRLR